MTIAGPLAYKKFYLSVRFEDGTACSFLASPVVAISIESALADISEAYGQRADLLKDYTAEIESLP